MSGSGREKAPKRPIKGRVYRAPSGRLCQWAGEAGQGGVIEPECELWFEYLTGDQRTPGPDGFVLTAGNLSLLREVPR